MRGDAPSGRVFERKECAATGEVFHIEANTAAPLPWREDISSELHHRGRPKDWRMTHLVAEVRQIMIGHPKHHNQLVQQMLNCMSQQSAATSS